MENKETQQDFFRLVKTHSDIIDLLRVEKRLIDLISTELQNGHEANLPVFTQGTIESDIFENLIDIKLDSDLPKIFEIMSKYSHIMWQIIDKEIGISNSTFDDMDKYLEEQIEKEKQKCE